MTLKRVTALIIALMSFAALCIPAFAAKMPARDGEAVTVTHYGDANMDGIINTADATVILKHASGIANITDPVQLDYADANRDGLTNTADAAFVLRIAAGMQEAIPVDGTEPTEAPTGEPTGQPSEIPTEQPTDQPTAAPTEQPTQEPVQTQAPTPDPTPSQAPTPEPGKVTITFLPGDDADNGGGIKKDGFMPDEQVITGEYGILYKNKIPHSVTNVKGEKNAYAFTHWTDEQGNIYFPGDRIYTHGEESEMTLTANWESGYTVITGPDEIETYIFNNLNVKAILGCDIACYYVSSAYLFPIGFDQNSPWDQILYEGAFTGKLDGAGYTIRNLTCEYWKSDICSAFFYQNKGTVSNLTLKVNQIYSHADKIAAVACTNYGTIRNVDVTWDNRNNYHYATDLNVELCSSLVTYDFDNLEAVCPKIGCIASENYGTIANCDVLEMKIKVCHGWGAGITAYNAEGALVDNCRSDGVKIYFIYDHEYYEVGGYEVNPLISVNLGTMTNCTDTGFVKVMTNDFAAQSIPALPDRFTRREEY